MDVPVGENPVAQAIAHALIEGFDKHYRIFRETSRRAKELFEAADWHAQLDAVHRRVQFYDQRVDETVHRLHQEFDADSLDDTTWQQVKLHFIGMLINHKQPELAETFFNSVCCKILHRAYFNNDYIFARPAMAVEYIESFPPVYSSYYPRDVGLRATIKSIIEDFDWERPFEDLDRDVNYILRTAHAFFVKWPAMEVNSQIQVLYAAFYRNKTAYIIGKAINGYQDYPFAIAVRHSPKAAGSTSTPSCSTPGAYRCFFHYRAPTSWSTWKCPLATCISCARSCPSNRAPSCTRCSVWASRARRCSSATCSPICAIRTTSSSSRPASAGSSCWCSPCRPTPTCSRSSRTSSAPPRTWTARRSRRNTRWSRRSTASGAWQTRWNISNVALPLSRFHPELLDELQTLAASSFEIDGDSVVIGHCYIERRMTPLNIYLEKADDEQTEHVVREYGNAIREMATANIFPGDMLWKNFGVTRYGRVVFYDYDEIEYMTDCKFRRIPPAPYPEMEMASEPWYSAGPLDVFPEEFATFLLGRPSIRKAFVKYHRDLLDARFWQEAQERLRDGHVEDFFPYPLEMRFTNAFAGDKAKSSASAETA